MTPSLNKSFKFQSDWPYNNSQVYLLNSVLEDLKEDEKRTFDSVDEGYVFSSKVNYPNNKSLVKQKVYMNKDSKVTKVEVVDKDNNVLISMNYNKIEYDKKFGENYFELNSIIKTSDDKNTANNKLEQDSSNVSEGKVNNNKQSTNSDVNSNDKNISTNNSQTESDNNNDSKESDDSEEVKTQETLSIDDIIYPMYLPDNTYLTSQNRVDTEDGERLILTFGGDNSFVLVEETISENNSNLVIPVNGEFEFLSDVIGIVGTNSVMWHSNGIEYYMTSDTLETSVLIDIARSISVLPVSK